MKEDIATRIKKLQMLVFESCEKAFDVDVKSILEATDKPFLSKFFYIPKDAYSRCVNETVGDMPLYRYFVGWDSAETEEEKARVKAIYDECCEDINKLENLEDPIEKAKAESALAEKFKDNLIYKNDDVVTIVTAYVMMMHPTDDLDTFTAYKKRTKRILNKYNIEDLNDVEFIKDVCKKNRIKYEDDFGEGLVYFSKL